MAYTLIASYQVNGKNIYGVDLAPYHYGIDVYVEQSDAINNYSNVKTVAWVMADANVSTTSSSTYHFKDNGSTYQSIYIKLGVKDNAGYAVPYHANEKTTKYYHNSDGTKTITVNFSVETEYTAGANANINNNAFKSASISKTITLPTINRLSPFSWDGDFTMGASKRIKISPYVSGYTHTLTYSFGSKSGTIGTNLSTYVDWTPPKDLGGQITTSTSGVGTITCKTYNGSTLIGTSSKTFTLWVSGDMYPTFDYTFTENNTFNGLLLSTRSTVKFEITNAVGSEGSTIKSYSITGEGLNSTSVSGTTSKFSKSGTFTYTLSVTDSRNRTATKVKSVVVHNYFSPQVTLVSLSRADINYNISDVGEYLYCEINYSIANPNSKNENQKTYNLQYREEGNESWTTSLSSRDFTSYNSNGFLIKPTTTFDASKSYEIRIGVKDEFSTTYVTGTIPTSTCILDIEPLGVGIGKYHQHGSLDIAGEIYHEGEKFYEVGTFSPSFFCGSGTKQTLTRNEATYQLIGKYCICNIALIAQNFSAGNKTDDFKIVNLPFYNKGGYTAASIGYCSGLMRGTYSTLVAYVRPSANEIAFNFNDYQDGSCHFPKSASCSSNIDLQVSIVYKVRE